MDPRTRLPRPNRSGATAASRTVSVRTVSEKTPIGVSTSGSERPPRVYSGNVGSRTARVISALASAPPKPPSHQKA